MKIFEITEVDSKIGTVKVNKGPLKGFIFDPLGDGRIKVTAPDGTSMTATSQADAEKKARKHIRTTTPDTPTKKTNTPTKTDVDTGGKKEPYIDKDAKIDTKDIGRKEPKITDPNKTDVDTDKPNPLKTATKDTPTRDQLSGMKYKKLEKDGFIQYKGKTYTLDQVKDATEKANALKKLDKGKFGSTIDVAKKFAGRLVRLFTFPGIGFGLNTVWNATQVEDIFDSYLREIQRHAKTLKPAERAKFVKNLIDQDTGKLPREVGAAYLRALESITELMFEFVVGALIAVPTAVGVPALIAAIFPAVTTAWITVPVGIILGATFIIGGTAAVEKLVDALGGMDYLEDMIAPVFNPKAVVALAIQTDNLQNIFGISLDTLNMVPGLNIVVPSGDFVRDTAKNETTLQEKQTTSSEAKRKIIALVKSDPEIQDAYLAGKDKAKKLVKSNFKTIKKITGEAT
jgi:hypothetical protein